MTIKGQIKYKLSFNGLYLMNGGLSVDLMIFDLGWPLTLDDI